MGCDASCHGEVVALCPESATVADPLAAWDNDYFTRCGVDTWRNDVFERSAGTEALHGRNEMRARVALALAYDAARRGKLRDERAPAARISQALDRHERRFPERRWSRVPAGGPFLLGFRWREQPASYPVSAELELLLREVPSGAGERLVGEKPVLTDIVSPTGRARPWLLRALDTFAPAQPPGPPPSVLRAHVRASAAAAPASRSSSAFAVAVAAALAYVVARAIAR